MSKSAKGYLYKEPSNQDDSGSSSGWGSGKACGWGKGDTTLVSHHNLTRGLGAGINNNGAGHGVGMFYGPDRSSIFV